MIFLTACHDVMAITTQPLKAGVVLTGTAVLLLFEKRSTQFSPKKDIVRRVRFEVKRDKWNENTFELTKKTCCRECFHNSKNYFSAQHITIFQGWTVLHKTFGNFSNSTRFFSDVRTSRECGKHSVIQASFAKNMRKHSPSCSLYFRPGFPNDIHP